MATGFCPSFVVIVTCSRSASTISKKVVSVALSSTTYIFELGRHESSLMQLINYAAIAYESSQTVLSSVYIGFVRVP